MKLMGMGVNQALFTCLKCNRSSKVEFSLKMSVLDVFNNGLTQCF